MNRWPLSEPSVRAALHLAANNIHIVIENTSRLSDRTPVEYSRTVLCSEHLEISITYKRPHHCFRFHNPWDESVIHPFFMVSISNRIDPTSFDTS